MPPHLPPLSPPTSSSFAAWFDKQPQAVGRFVEHCIRRRVFQQLPALGYDLAELVEEVLWNCYRRDTILDPARWKWSLACYVGTVAHSVQCRWVEIAKRRPSGYQLPNALDEDSALDGPLDRADVGMAQLPAETRRRIVEVLASLPPSRGRTVFILMVYTGRDFVSFARLLGDTHKNMNSNGTREARKFFEGKFKSAAIERFGFAWWRETFGQSDDDEIQGTAAAE